MFHDVLLSYLQGVRRRKKVNGLSHPLLECSLIHMYMSSVCMCIGLFLGDKHNNIFSWCICMHMYICRYVCVYYVVSM